MSDSPSNKTLKLFGVPISFNRATTATGSVAAIIDPIVNASAQSKLSYYSIYFNIIAIKKHNSATPGNANNIIYHIDLENVKKSALKADSKIKGGMNTNNKV